MANGKRYDVAVIGGGPGGYVAALRATQLGCSVACIEERDLGGTCLNRGCIPSKALLYSAHMLECCEGATRFGINVDNISVDLKKVRQHKDRCVKQLVSGVGTLLDKAQVDVLTGHGRFVSDHEIAVKGPDVDTVIEADTIIIATGSSPAAPPIEGIDGPGVWGSDQALALERIPESMIIVGSGATGMEMACIYIHFGAKVTMLEMFDRALPREDPEASDVIMRTFKRRGGRMELGARVVRIEDAPGGKRAIFVRDGEEHTVEAEVVLGTVGRRANLDNLGAEEVGLNLERQGICVQDGVTTPASEGPPLAVCPGTRLQTAHSHIYAVGDCIRGIGLAHLAMHEGVAAVEDSQGIPSQINYAAVPTAMYCHPEIASVGLFEYQADELGIDVVVGKFPFAANGRAVAMASREGFAKVVAEAGTGKVLGATVVGRMTTELVAEITLAVQMGATLDDVSRVIHAHPTLSESVYEAVLSGLGRPLHVPAP